MIYEVEPPDPMIDRAISEPEMWADDRSAGTDTPGRSNARPWPGSAAVVSQVAPAGNDDRMALMCILLHAARALAMSQITISTGVERITICAACGEQTPTGIPARHRSTCLAAEVISIITRLAQTLEPNPQRKELASDAEEQVSADDGNQPRSPLSHAGLLIPS
jgi:hypothetical protein